MTDKSEVWDITASAVVTFKRVVFDQELTEEEAEKAFRERNFVMYFDEETDPDAIIKILSLEKI